MLRTGTLSFIRFSSSVASKRPPKRLVWVDCETTGLDPFKDNIIEICCFITDFHLNFVEEKGFEAKIHAPLEKLEAMDPRVVQMHKSSGLWEECLASENTAKDVENNLIEYIQSHVHKNKGYLAGNNVGFDRMFLQREMPLIPNYLHYRIIDVSTINELGKIENPELMRRRPKKMLRHTARSDILESIKELQFYQENLFKKPLSILGPLKKKM